MTRIVFGSMTIKEAEKLVNMPKRRPPDAQLRTRLDEFRALCEKAADASCILNPRDYRYNVKRRGPLFAHCHVVAYAVYERFKGMIVQGHVQDKSQGRQPHFWNIIGDDVHVDLTSKQFYGDGICPVENSKVVYILSSWFLEELGNMEITKRFMGRLSVVETLDVLDRIAG